MSAMKRAAIYLRVSTVAQATRGREPEGYSIPAQREACQAKAAELDAEVIAEYVDRGESAKTADRPELKELLARLDEKRDLDYVIVHKVDRLARNRYDDVTITYALHEAGVELVSVTENIDRTPVGRFMHAIVAANAEFYSANLAAEAKKGLVQKAKMGGTPSKAPLGYLNVRKLIEGQEVRTVEIDPERAPHVRWAFAAYGSGAYTLETPRAALTERGLRTRPTPRKPEKPLSRTQLASMLQNPYYVGVVRYARVEYEGRHEHLLDQHTFAKAKAVLAAHASSSEKDRKHHHYLKGSLYCGRCGSRMSFTYAKGNGGGYAYFYCLGRTRGTGCEQPYVPVDLIETAVENAYGDVRLPRKQTERVRGKLSHALGGMREQAEAEATRQRKRLAKLTEEREKLLHAYYAGPSLSTCCAPSRTGSPPRPTRPSATSGSPRRPSPTSRTPSVRHSICSPIASAPTWPLLAIYGGNGTRRSSTGWWSTTTRSGRPRSLSPSPRSPTRNCPRAWVARLSPPAPFLLALVRVRPFQWS
jgi:DNA invertase Pin-like site-specific DNA recombinase